MIAPRKDRKTPTHPRWESKYGTPWTIETRNELMLKWCAGNEEAVDFVNRLGSISELWDDLVDQDVPIGAERIHDGFAWLLQELALHPFYQRFGASLQPLMMLCVQAYLDSERLRERDETKEDRIHAFALRMFFIEIVIFASMVTAGVPAAREYSMEIRDFFYHDEFDEWSKGASDAG